MPPAPPAPPSTPLRKRATEAPSKLQPKPTEMHHTPAKGSLSVSSRPGLLPPSRPQSMPQTPPDARPSPASTRPLMHFGEFWLEFEIRLLLQAPDSVRRMERSLIDAVQEAAAEAKTESSRAPAASRGDLVPAALAHFTALAAPAASTPPRDPSPALRRDIHTSRCLSVFPPSQVVENLSACRPKPKLSGNRKSESLSFSRTKRAMPPNKQDGCSKRDKRCAAPRQRAAWSPIGTPCASRVNAPPAASASQPASTSRPKAPRKSVQVRASRSPSAPQSCGRNTSGSTSQPASASRPAAHCNPRAPASC